MDQDDSSKDSHGPVCGLLLAGVLAFAVLSNAAQAQVNMQHQECLGDGHGRPPADATYAFYYVAPNGRDSWSGTLAEPNHGLTDGPFATFERARDAVRSLNKTGLKQVTVWFRGGTYYLPATVRLTAADSGSPSFRITYAAFPGETPVFSGGVRLQNWTNTSGNTWETTLPASTAYLEDLFYNGVRRLRPRLGGYLGTYYHVRDEVYLDAQAHNCDDNVSGKGWKCYDRFRYKASEFKDDVTWENLAARNPCNQPPPGTPPSPRMSSSSSGRYTRLPSSAYVASIRTTRSFTPPAPSDKTSSQKTIT